MTIGYAAEPARLGVAQLPVVIIDDDAVAENDVNRRVRERRGNARQRAGQQHVIGVDIAKNATLRGREPLVESIGRAFDGLEQPRCDAIAVAQRDFAAAIGRTGIDNNVIKRWIALSDNRLDRRRQETRLIVRNRHDRDRRRHGARCGQWRGSPRTNSASICSMRCVAGSAKPGHSVHISNPATRICAMIVSKSACPA